MMLVAVLTATLVLCTAGEGAPPFIILSPPAYRIGHQSNMKLMMFTENRGNITVKYYTVTHDYSSGDYRRIETVLTTEVFPILPSEKIVDIPIQIPQDGTDGTNNVDVDAYIEDYGDFKIAGKTFYPSKSGFKTYIQTDKPIYKPGQTVRFRGFSIDSSLQGVSNGTLSVEISNPDGIKVFEDSNVDSENGVIHKGEFILAEEAKLGSYKISVESLGGMISASCSFSVEEYVLPKFGVEIQGPGHIDRDDTTVKGKLTATYTYGKPVNGKVNLKFAIDNKIQRSYNGPYYFKDISAELVDGKLDWEVDIGELTGSKLKYLFNPWCTPSTLIIAATVSDEFGGFMVEELDSSTKFSQSSVKMTFSPNTETHYAAGFPYYVELDVQAETMTADELKNVPIKVTMTSGLQDLKYETKKVFVKDGKVVVSFNVPEAACAVKITAEMDSDSACETVFACFQPERLVSKSGDFVRFFKTDVEQYRAGDTMMYKLVSKSRFEILNFVLVSKGNIVKSWMTEPMWNTFEHDKSIAEFTLELPSDMIVRSKLIVLSANSANGFIVADYLDIPMEEELQHEMQLQFSGSTVKPGDKISLTLTSDPASFVGISVTDSSLTLLREPCKVLTKESTLSFLRYLDEGVVKDLSCKRDDPFQCKSSTEVKIIDVKDLLTNVGLEIDTNMNIYEYSEPAVDYDGPWSYGRKYGGNMLPTQLFEMDYEYADSDDMDMSSDIEEAVEDEPQARNFFPESWIWTDTTSDENGQTVLSLEAPDTITSWTGSAFGLSPNRGLGFSNEVQLETFMPFFISLDLPYSGTVGERITVPIRVFNYKSKTADVVLEISSKLWPEKSTSFSVPPNEAITSDYTITLTEAGNHEILVKAISNLGDSDAVEKSLFVQPGGEKVVDVSSVLVMRNHDDSIERSYMMVSLPETYIAGSHKLKLVAVGDILGEAVSGISSLIQLPSGCGEQNMHKIAINVFAAKYLRSMYNDLPEHIEYNLRHGLNVGWQQQLAYRQGSHYNSYGYSIFRGQPTSHWLTSFVYRVANQFPEDIIKIDCRPIERDLDYMLSWMKTDKESGKVSLDRKGWAPYQYSYHENRELYWQSFLLISTLEMGQFKQNTVCDYLSAKSSGSVEKLCNATVELARQSSRDCCYYHMVEYAISLCRVHGIINSTNSNDRLSQDSNICLGSTQSGQHKFATCEENLEYDGMRASSRSIEATGYAVLLSLLQFDMELERNVLPMVMWLTDQRSENGGFRSSQDTVIGLQALSAFATWTNLINPSNGTDLQILLGKGNTFFERIRIREETKLSTKEVIINNGPGKYKLRLSGHGTAFVQLISTYHITGKEYEPIFRLRAKAVGGRRAMVKVGFRLPKESSSTMFLLEVSVPTGMIITKSLVEGKIREDGNDFKNIARYDIKEGGQRLQLYIDPLTKKQDFELVIPLDSKFTVMDRKPAQISLVDYYNPSSRETIFYSLDSSDEL